MNTIVEERPQTSLNSAAPPLIQAPKKSLRPLWTAWAIWVATGLGGLMAVYGMGKNDPSGVGTSLGILAGLVAAFVASIYVSRAAITLLKGRPFVLPAIMLPWVLWRLILVLLLRW